MPCLNNNEKKFKYNETQKTVEQKDDIKTYLSVFDVISIYKQFFVSNKITYSEKWVYFTTLFREMGLFYYTISESCVYWTLYKS